MPDIAYLTGQDETGPLPRAVGQKFAADGRVLPFAGNTFLCHIPRPSPAFDALCAAQDQLRAGPVAHAFAFLPPASFHMTVFQGVTDAHRSGANWPAGLPSSTPVSEVTDTFRSHLTGLRAEPQFRVSSHKIFGGFSVRLRGATEQDETTLRTLRDLLSTTLGLRQEGHDSYEFHITLGYLLRWLTLAEAEATMACATAAYRALGSALQGLNLGPVEFCRFDSMSHFEPIPHLDPPK